ncbi:MAG: hypothetical protein ACHQ6U_02255 [Thermodesulfobacteriota bacterium]
MISGNQIDNTKIRRRGSMLNVIIRNIKYLFVFAFILLIPTMRNAVAGVVGVPGSPFNYFDPVDQTDTGAQRLVYYWDLRSRDTIIQITNVDVDSHFVHIQIFNANDPSLTCNECDFDIRMTPGESDVFDVAKLTGTGCTVAANGYGLITATADSYIFTGVSTGTTGTAGVQTRTISIDEFSGPLIGMFRIIDSAGNFEYRTNAANTEAIFFSRGALNPINFLENEVYNVLNFNNVANHAFSDVVGITYVALPGGNTYASPGVRTVFGGLDANFQNTIYDDSENFNSCSPTVFACDNAALTNMNKGIDHSIPNSLGSNPICSTAKLDGVPDFGPTDSGWLLLGFNYHKCIDPLVSLDTTDGDCAFPTYFAGFLGLNNGNGMGSMDSWVSVSELIFDYTFCVFNTSNPICSGLLSVP